MNTPHINTSKSGPGTAQAIESNLMVDLAPIPKERDYTTETLIKFLEPEYYFSWWEHKINGEHVTCLDGAESGCPLCKAGHKRRLAMSYNVAVYHGDMRYESVAIQAPSVMALAHFADRMQCIPNYAKSKPFDRWYFNVKTVSGNVVLYPVKPEEMETDYGVRVPEGTDYGALKLHTGSPLQEVSLQHHKHLAKQYEVIKARQAKANGDEVPDIKTKTGTTNAMMEPRANSRAEKASRLKARAVAS